MTAYEPSFAVLHLDEYDAARFGPLLGVSDDGGAVSEIVRAAQESAKAVAAATQQAEVLGLIVDGERMTSGGEAPIGPAQYLELAWSTGLGGKAYCTTNVSIRVNARTDRPLPELHFGTDEDVATVVGRLVDLFEPFVNTPDHKPRPLLVRLSLPAEGAVQRLAALDEVATQVKRQREAGSVGPADVHRLGLLIIFNAPIGPSQLPLIKDLIDHAANLHIGHVAVDGPLVPAARARMGVQGLLNVLPPEHVNELLAYANNRKVTLEPRYTFDEISAAVGVWTGMQCARRFDFAGAKYGLAPLTFEEQETVIAAVQSWAPLTAIPAFYADTPLITTDRVFLSDEAGEALRLWLNMVAQHRVSLVLVDCPDRIPPRIDVPEKQQARPLIRTGASSKGIFTTTQAGEISSEARELGIRVLWSGGINRQAAFDLGLQKVFGIFTTSATARRIPVGGVLAADPQLAAEGEPTYDGVRQVHALLQAGFLCAVINEARIVDPIETAAKRVIAIEAADRSFPVSLDKLNTELVKGWKLHWNESADNV